MIRASADEATLSVTVANTPEHQEALQKVSTYGNKFYMTGGKYTSPWTTYSLPPRCKIEREKMQKWRVKKLCIDFHVWRGAAFVVLNRLEHKLDNNIARLCNKELEVLLKWKGIGVYKMSNMANKRLLYQQFAGDRGVILPDGRRPMRRLSSRAIRGAEEEGRQNSIPKDVR